MTKLCDYGCGREATTYFNLKNKWCCSKQLTGCPAYISQNLIQCKYCETKIIKSAIKHHVENCYLNPKNKKLCPICNKPIKNYRTSTTCSFACANTLFRSGENHGNWINGKTSCREICFQYHKHKCIICEEKLVVEAHHYDSDKKNNNSENLIPLCPTHHRYWHSRYRYLIKNKIDKYRQEFIKKKLKGGKV